MNDHQSSNIHYIITLFLEEMGKNPRPTASDLPSSISLLANVLQNFAVHETVGRMLEATATMIFLNLPFVNQALKFFKKERKYICNFYYPNIKFLRSSLPAANIKKTCQTSKSTRIFC